MRLPFWGGHRDLAQPTELRVTNPGHAKPRQAPAGTRVPLGNRNQSCFFGETNLHPKTLRGIVTVQFVRSEHLGWHIASHDRCRPPQGMWPKE